jgi:hypothetical protein
MTPKLVDDGSSEESGVISELEERGVSVLKGPNSMVLIWL